MYDIFLTLLVDAFGATANTVFYLCLEVFASCCCIFVAVLPFLVVWLAIRFIFNTLR